MTTTTTVVRTKTNKRRRPPPPSRQKTTTTPPKKSTTTQKAALRTSSSSSMVSPELCADELDTPLRSRGGVDWDDYHRNKHPEVLSRFRSYNQPKTFKESVHALRRAHCHPPHQSTIIEWLGDRRPGRNHPERERWRWIVHHPLSLVFVPSNKCFGIEKQQRHKNHHLHHLSRWY